MSVEPAFYSTLAESDLEFSSSEYMHKIEWLKHETEDVFDPTCDDVIRVAFMDECEQVCYAHRYCYRGFHRGQHCEFLVSHNFFRNFGRTFMPYLF